MTSAVIVKGYFFALRELKSAKNFQISGRSDTSNVGYKRKMSAATVGITLTC